MQMVLLLMLGTEWALFGGLTWCLCLRIISWLHPVHQKGNTVSFWNDLWDIGVPKWRFQQPFSFTRKKTLSVHQFLEWDLGRIFRLPLSQQASSQLVQIREEIEGLQLNSKGNDAWTYIWGSTVFQSHRANQSLWGTFPASVIYKWLWNYRGQHTHKFFIWLLIRDMLNTRSMLRRKNMDLIVVFCVSRMLRKTSIICFLIALSLVLVGHSWTSTGIRLWTFKPWCCVQERTLVQSFSER